MYLQVQMLIRSTDQKTRFQSDYWMKTEEMDWMWSLVGRQNHEETLSMLQDE